MNIVTVGDGLGWSCEALIHLGHAIQKIAGRKDKTLSKLERIARGLSQCGELRPEYHSIVLGKPFLVPDRFPSLEVQRKAVGTVLNGIVTAVEREMLAAHRESHVSGPRARSSDESFTWGMEDSPFIASVTEAINLIEEIEISPEVAVAFRAAH